MKSIVSIAALVAVAGSAAAQLDMAQPIQTGEPQFMATDGVAKVWNQAYVPASTKAGLDGNGYAVSHAVADIFVAQYMGADNAATIVSAGQASPFPLNFTGASGNRPIFYDPADPAWTDTAAVPLVVVDDPTVMLLNMDSDVETVPGTHEIVIRSWFVSDGASVFPFSQPSVAGSPSYTPTILTVNDALPEADRHPVGLGGDIGDAVTGLSTGGGLEPPAGMVWDQGGANVVTDWVILGFRQLDSAFVGVTFATFPTISFDGSDNLVVDFQALQPATLNFNPDTGTEDFSVGGGPIAWGDGLTDSYNAYALQFEMTVTAMAGGTPCPADFADDFGIPGGDGMVSFGDFLFLLGVAGPCPGGVPGCPGDIADGFGLPTPDGAVDFGDFLAVLAAAGPCP
jgi:hypothetical protein